VGRDGTRGYHSLLAAVAASGDALHSRLREGVASFVTETINRARRAGASGPITLRADSGFYNHNVLTACHQAVVTCSTTAWLDQAIQAAIAQISE
jgi:hypothetical protein